jgi:hypothetical protein
MTPSQIFRSRRIGARPLYSIGTFNSGVTVLSQQIRALNLAWAFVEEKLIDCIIPGRRVSKPKKIAIVGGGFAGLTFVAGLIPKQANAENHDLKSETLSCHSSTAATPVGFIRKFTIGQANEAK